MFGKKSLSTQKPSINVEVETIPAEFYGGANPVVNFKTVEKEIKIVKDAPAGITTAEKALLDKSTATGAGQKMHPANLLANKKFVLISGAILSLVFLAGATWYYWSQAQKAQVAVAPPPPVVTQPVAEETPVGEPQASVITAPEEEPVVTERPEILELPSRLLADTADMDNDGITDMAESSFQTDPAVPDTDGDKYPDGLEIYHLYNPAGFAPMKIIDAGLVKDYVNPGFDYSLYYPADWAVGSVDVQSTQVLFSALNGENIEARVFDLQPGESFAGWLGRIAPTEIAGDLQDFETVFKEKGKARADGLVYFFPTADKVYVLVYHAIEESTISFRAVLRMMARSFRLPLNAALIPAPIVERSGAEEERMLVATPTTPVEESTSTLMPAPAAGAGEEPML